MPWKGCKLILYMAGSLANFPKRNFRHFNFVNDWFTWDVHGWYTWEFSYDKFESLCQRSTLLFNAGGIFMEVHSDNAFSLPLAFWHSHASSTKNFGFYLIWSTRYLAHHPVTMVSLSEVTQCSVAVPCSVSSWLNHNSLLWTTDPCTVNVVYI